MAQQQRPARNAPCWCGSGKKYKNCHLQADEQEAASEMLSNRLQVSLQEYALQPRFDKDFRSAREFFYGNDFSLDEEDEDERLFVMQRALDYFIHDYRLGDERRLIEHFASEQSKRLRADERARLEQWMHSRLAGYEVIDIREGRGLRVRDLLEGDEFDILDRRASGQMSRWDVIFTRVLPAGDHYELSGVGLFIPPRFRDWIRSYAADLLRDYQDRHPVSSYEDFLHASSQLLNQFILNEVEPAMNRPPTVVTPERDLVELARATYQVVDRPLALAGLRGSVEFEEMTGAGGDEIEFAWNEAGESLDLLQQHGPPFEHKETGGRGEGENRSLGQIWLQADELRLEVVSERRLNAGKELLEKRLGSAIQFVEDEIRPLEDVLQSMPPSEPEEEGAEAEPEELEAFEAEAAARLKRGWIDEEVPALQNRTPREAVRTLLGRVMVIRLLKEFESAEMRQARAGGIPYSWEEVKNELGLTAQEFLVESQLEDRLADELQGIEEQADEEPAQALERWHALKKEYRIETAEDLDFAEVWDLYEIFEEAMLELAEHLASHKLFEQALALVHELREFDPDEAAQWLAEEGQIHVDRGEVEEGVRLLQSAAQADPEDYSTVSELAEVQQYQLNLPEEAIETLKRALSEMTDELDRREVHSHILEILMQLREFDRAEAFWHETNDPEAEEDRDYRDLSGVLIQRGDLDRAREAASRIADEHVRSYWLGRAEAAAGNYDRAREAWREKLEEPDLPYWWAWLEWTELHLRLHDVEPIIEHVGEGQIELAAYGFYYLAFAYGLKGNREKAAEVGRQARGVLEEERRPSTVPAILANLARLAREIHLSPEAIRAVGL